MNPYSYLACLGTYPYIYNSASLSIRRCLGIFAGSPELLEVPRAAIDTVFLGLSRKEPYIYLKMKIEGRTFVVSGG